MINKKIFFISTLLLIQTLISMEEKRVIIESDNATYPLNYSQASKSLVFKNMLDQQGEKYGTITLPETINKEAFEYIYKDLIGEPYDRTLLDDATLMTLFDAAHELEIDPLIDIYTALLKPIQISVSGKIFELTSQEAFQSNTLKHFLEDVATSEDEPLPLPTITADTFTIIYKDLKKLPYNTEILDFSSLINLINAANYLDIPHLLNKYLDLFVENLQKVQSQELLKQIYELIDELPEEMQQALSEKITTATLSFIDTLANFSPKREKARELPATDFFLSPNKKVLVFEERKNRESTLTCRDFLNNQLWQKNYARDYITTFFPLIVHKCLSLIVLIARAHYFCMIHIQEKIFGQKFFLGMQKF